MIFFKKAKATGATFMTSYKAVLLPVLQYIQFLKYLVPYSVPVIFWVTNRPSRLYLETIPNQGYMERF